MVKNIEKSWFTIDGRLEKIDFDGESYFRFPEELAELVINTYSNEGDWVIDPFAGFGTTLKVAQRLKRNAIGFEINKTRAQFANRELKEPNKIINARIETLDAVTLPKFDLLFTSPPYVTVRLEDDPWGKTYFEDMTSIFRKLKNVLKQDAAIVVEISNIRTRDGIRPLAWEMGNILSEIFEFQGEIIRCNTGETEAGPGFNHSYLLTYKNRF